MKASFLEEKFIEMLLVNLIGGKSEFVAELCGYNFDQLNLLLYGEVACLYLLNIKIDFIESPCARTEEHFDLFD